MNILDIVFSTNFIIFIAIPLLARAALHLAERYRPEHLAKYNKHYLIAFCVYMILFLFFYSGKPQLSPLPVMTQTEQKAEREKAAEYFKDPPVPVPGKGPGIIRFKE